jgi:HSP20 family protein
MKIKNLIPWSREKEDGVFKYENENPFFALQREMNRMFDNFSHTLFDDSPFMKEMSLSKTIHPKVDVVETEKEIQVTAELPGMDEKDIEVNFSRDSLVIRGEKKVEKEDKKKGYYLMERSYGSFHRAIPVPAGVDTEKVDAKFKNGVLKITMPKTPEAQKETKKIAVKCE